MSGGWGEDYGADIARALATPGGHLSIGRGGCTLRYDNSRLSGCNLEAIKAQAIAAPPRSSIVVMRPLGSSHAWRVLDHPEIPLHTNGAERDIRCHVTKRKVSGGTRSDLGRACRDAFLGLTKTRDKLGIAFWDYLGSRLAIPAAPTVPYLPDLIRCRGQPA